MIRRLVESLRDRNPWAARRLSSRAHRPGGFVCRGRIQLHLDSTAIVTPPDSVSSLGVPLLGHGTPRSQTTVVSVADHATLGLDGARVGRGAVIVVGPGARLTIGKRSYVADGSRISASQAIDIGADCAISWGVTIIDDDGHGWGPPPYAAPIRVGDRVWIGCNVIVLKGVTIGRDTAIAAGSVVTRSCPPGSLLAGVPARVIRADVSWHPLHRTGGL